MAKKLIHLNLGGARYLYTTIHGIRVVAPDRRTIHEMTKAIDILRRNTAAYRKVLRTRMLVCVSRPVGILHGYMSARLNFEPIFLRHPERVLRMDPLWLASVHENQHASDFLSNKITRVGYETVYHPMSLHEGEVRASEEQATFLQHAGAPEHWVPYVLRYPADGRDWKKYESGSYFSGGEYRQVNFIGEHLYIHLQRCGIVKSLHLKKKRLAQ